MDCSILADVRRAVRVPWWIVSKREKKQEGKRCMEINHHMDRSWLRPAWIVSGKQKMDAASIRRWAWLLDEAQTNMRVRLGLGLRHEDWKIRPHEIYRMLGKHDRQNPKKTELCAGFDSDQNLAQVKPAARRWSRLHYTAMQQAKRGNSAFSLVFFLRKLNFQHYFPKGNLNSTKFKIKHSV